MLKKKYKLLFFGKKNDTFSKKIILFLNQKFDLIYFLSSSPNENFDIKLEKINNIDFIFCFRSYYLLKKNILSKVKYQSINFHPGPPEYRGIGCVNFAILNDSKFYGLTAHLIDQEIDHGKIINVRRLKIKKNDTIQELLNKTYKLQILQIKKIVNHLLKKKCNIDELINENKKEKWSKKLYTRSDLNKLYVIKKNISKKNLKLRLRATITDKFKPHVVLHKKKFYHSES